LSQSPNDLNKQGVRYDQGKLRWDLLPPDAMEELVKVYTEGAKKYADRNWELGMNWGRIFRAMMSHAFKFWKGNRYDDELDTHHMAMVAWNALALVAYDLRKVGKDDRPLQALVNGAGTSPIRTGQAASGGQDSKDREQKTQGPATAT